MKKKYIVLIVILILIIVIAGIFIYERLHASLYVNEEGTSFDVYGGADGPTAILLLERYQMKAKMRQCQTRKMK